MKEKAGGISRREFISKSTTAAFLAVSSAAAVSSGVAQSAATKRLALVGTGSRGTAPWGESLVRDYSNYIEMVGLCDVNRKRLDYARKKIGSHIPTFTDFDLMVRSTKPDAVIVTTVDGYHANYVNRAMELGCDALSEKPLCTDAEQAQSIIDTCRKTGRRLDVTFNARYGQSSMKAKELLLNGEIGDIYSVDYAEFLDLDHGASYFRRWHGLKKCSGTLLCHKASHHFDQLNWWIDSEPVEVTAYGDLKKYGINGPFRHANCRLCIYQDKCPFFWDITKNRRFMELYVECESEDGYYRDACLYRRAIDIYDTMSVLVKYENGVLVTYSLNATSETEGQYIVFHGSKGRLELHNYDRESWNVAPRSHVRLWKNFEGSTIVPFQPRRVSGGHGGSDTLIKDKLFKPGVSDELGQRAGVREGILSSMIGIAAYTSIEQKRPVRIDELISFG